MVWNARYFPLNAGSFLGGVTCSGVQLCQVLPALFVILICLLSLSSPMEFSNYVCKNYKSCGEHPFFFFFSWLLFLLLLPLTPLTLLFLIFLLRAPSLHLPPCTKDKEHAELTFTLRSSPAIDIQYP